MGNKYDPKNLLIKGQRFIKSKKEDEEKSKSQPEETISERVKLRRQIADETCLTRHRLLLMEIMTILRNLLIFQICHR